MASRGLESDLLRIVTENKASVLGQDPKPSEVHGGIHGHFAAAALESPVPDA